MFSKLLPENMMADVLLLPGRTTSKSFKVNLYYLVSALLSLDSYTDNNGQSTSSACLW